MKFPTLYKVLFEGDTSSKLTGGYSGFNYRPYLPTPTGPGRPTPSKDRLTLCRVGWHVTDNPKVWRGLTEDARVFVVEPSGNFVGKCPSSYHIELLGPDFNKIAFQSITLLYEVVYKHGKWIRKAMRAK